MKYSDYLKEASLESELEKKGKKIGMNVKNKMPIYLLKGSVWTKEQGDHTYRNVGELSKYKEMLKKSSFMKTIFKLDKGI